MSTPAPQVGQLPDYDHPLMRNCSALLPLNEGGGSLVFNYGLDSTERHATVSGTPSGTWFGKDSFPFATLDGTNDEILVTDVNADFTEGFGKHKTLSCWVNTLVVPVTDPVVIWGIRGSNNSRWIGLCVNTDGTAMARHSYASTSDVTSSVTINDGKWHHLASVHVSGTERHLYVDGVYIGVSTGSQNTTSDILGYWTGRNVNNGERFSGNIAIPMAWRRVLGTSEIQELYRNPWAPFSRRSTITTATAAAAATTATSVRVTRDASSLGPAVGELPDYSSSIMDGCVGWWPLNEQSGSTVHDISMGSNHLTLNGMTPSSDWVSSDRGPAIVFDGTDDYLDGPGDLLNVSNSKVFAISCWLWKDSSWTNAFNEGLVGCVNHSFTTNVAMIGLSGTSTQKLQSQYRSGGSNKVYLGATDVTDNVWHHCVLTSDGTNSFLYLDGLEDGSNSVPTTLPTNLTTSIARKGSAYGEIQVKDVRFYQRHLDSSEIQELYQDPWGPFRRKSTISFGTAAAEDTTTVVGGLHNIEYGSVKGLHAIEYGIVS